MERLSGEAYRTIQLCVDSYEQGVLRGRFYYAGLADGCRTFQSLTQFLVEMEQILDEANYPQSYTAKRTFGTIPAVRPTGNAGNEIRNGAIATFMIRLLFRQHASWQGSVTWIEGRGEQSFRSVLELILLIDSALEDCTGEEEAAK